MSATSIAQATAQFAATKAALAGKTITDFKIVSGYGFDWYENGVHKSAPVDAVKSGDQDFINTFSNLMGLAKSDNGLGLTASSTAGLTNSPLFQLGVFGIVIYLIYKLFFAKKKRR